MNFRASLTAAALAAALMLPGAAEARDRTEGWSEWTARAERIYAAMLTTQSARLDSACSGVTRTVVGQGFAFPNWAQGLIQVCTVTQAAYHGSGNNRRSKQICRDLGRVSKLIGKATDVPEGPGASEVAHRISRAMVAIRDQICVNFR